MKTQTLFLRKLPSKAKLAEGVSIKAEKYLVIYDGRLEKNEEFREWIGKFAYTYKVKAGESLKNLDQFPAHIKKIFKLVSPFSARSLCVVAVGGGTVGDFAGFVASVMKRGVPLIHVPTTLLAAMDSAHGGKTALNVGDLKNQVGSFYPAGQVLIVRSFFEDLPPLQLQSALGELAKMAFIEGGALLDSFTATKKWDLDFIWNELALVIEAKNKWVEKDPLEVSGERQVLNFGHSLGHVLEGYFGLPHGVAVGEGLIFAVLWSHHQGYMSAKDRDQAMEILIHLGFLKPEDFIKQHRPLSESRLNRFISEDKKLLDAHHLNFVFLEKPGKPFVKRVALQSFITETQRQGWARH